jgi:hypothetical protein
MMLTSMEYPHWIMVVGGVLVAFGLIGVASKRKTNGTPVNDVEIEPEAMPNNNSRSPRKIDWSPAPSDPGGKSEKHGDRVGQGTTK